MASPAALNALLDKTSDWDKDERYMATNDLIQELQKDAQLDACLLYTSPSPRDRQKSRMPSSA